VGGSYVGDPASVGRLRSTSVKIDKVQIAAVVALSDASVRLKNCIRAGMAANALPATTVGEYTAGLPHIEQAFLSLPNYGRKCATELTDLIAHWSSAASNAVSSADFLRSLSIERDAASLGVEIAPSTEMSQENAPTVESDRVRFLRILQKTKFPGCVLDQPVSVRLRNTLNEAVLSEFPADLSTVLSNWQEFVEAFTNRPNVGRTTIAEMDKCIGRYIQSLIIEAPPLKWSILRYGFSKEDHDGEKETYG